MSSSSAAIQRKADDGSESEDEKTDWSEDFFKRRKEKVVAYHGNSPRTKVAIVTENGDEDEKQKKMLLEKTGTDQIKYKVFPIKEEPYRAEKVIKRVIDWGPTNVVINIPEDKRKDMVDVLQGKGEADRFAIEGIEYERLRRHIQFRIDNPSFLFGALRDTWEASGAVLMSRSPITDEGWKDKLIHLIEEKKVKNAKETVITIISGTHSDIKGKSGFSYAKHLDDGFAKEDADIIQDLQKDERTKNMTFELINIKDYQVDEDKKNYVTKSEELCQKILDVKTNFLILSWCHSLNGDVCNMLRSNAVLGRLFLEAETGFHLASGHGQADTERALLQDFAP